MTDNLKVPPHSIEAEQSVLGSMLIDPNSWDKVIEIISHDDFYSRSHSEIYKSIEYLIRCNQPVDLITVTDHLESINKLNDIGGFSYVGEVARNTPSSANVVTYAEIIKHRSVMRKMCGVAHEISEKTYNHNGADIKEIISFAESSVMKVGDAVYEQSKKTDMKSIILRHCDDMEDRVSRKAELIGVTTGLTDLDKKIGGLRVGPNILAARPSMGKTALALKMCLSAAISGEPVLIFSLEMPEDQLFRRMISIIGNIEIAWLENPRLIPEHLEDEFWAKHTAAIGMLSELKIEIIDQPALSVTDVNIYARRFKTRFGKVGLMMLDYLQLMKGESKENRTQEVSSLSIGLTAAAKIFNCPFLILSQLNRGLESRSDKRPINSDLRESGQIEQDAVLTMFIYREEVYDENTPNKGLAELILGKNRNGPIGMVGLSWHGYKTQFSDIGERQIVIPEKPIKSEGFKVK